MTTYHPREIARPIQEALREFPVVVLTGLRQTGKSTLIERDPAFRGRRTVTLDDFAQLESAERDPEAFLEGPDPLTIDEVQRAPRLFLAIKRAVDRNRKPGRFLLSGSANLHLLKGVSESLAGRALYLSIHPFNAREVLGRQAKNPFLWRFFDRLKFDPAPSQPLRPHDILKGGLPSVCLGETRRPDLWFKGYEQTYIGRDLRQLSQVSDLLSFRRVMQLAALRTGNLLNTSDLGRDAGTNAQTTTRYLNLLETSFITMRLPPFLRNPAARLIKSSKIYVTDAGLAAHLSGVLRSDPSLSGPMRGPLFETFAAQNLASLLESHRPDATLSFWSVQGRHEVDFVIESGSSVMAIEIKSAARWGESDLSGLKAFLAATPRCHAAILAYNGSDSVKLGDRLWAIPLRRLLS